MLLVFGGNIGVWVLIITLYNFILLWGGYVSVKNPLHGGFFLVKFIYNFVWSLYVTTSKSITFLISYRSP